MVGAKRKINMGYYRSKQKESGKAFQEEVIVKQTLRSHPDEAEPLAHWDPYTV